MHRKMIKHLEGDIKSFKKLEDEDKKFVGKLRKVNEKEEKSCSCKNHPRKRSEGKAGSGRKAEPKKRVVKRR